jgi:hypothetical protein
MITVVVGRDERDKDAARCGVVHVGRKGSRVSSGSRVGSGRMGVVSAEMRLRIVLAVGLERVAQDWALLALSCSCFLDGLTARLLPSLSSRKM